MVGGGRCDVVAGKALVFSRVVATNVPGLRVSPVGEVAEREQYRSIEGVETVK